MEYRMPKSANSERAILDTLEGKLTPSTLWA